MCTVDISTINVIVHIKTPPKRNEVKNNTLCPFYKLFKQE